MRGASFGAFVVLALTTACVGCAGCRGSDATANLNADDELELSTIVIRADFSDEAAWQQVRAAITAPVGPYQANLICVEDAQYDGITVERLLKTLPRPFRHTFVFIVDRKALIEPEHPVLVVDVIEQPGRTFRVIPALMWSVQNNLKLANMDWEEFSESTDPDGVFRGFPR